MLLELEIFQPCIQLKRSLSKIFLVFSDEEAHLIKRDSAFLLLGLRQSAFNLISVFQPKFHKDIVRNIYIKYCLTFFCVFHYYNKGHFAA